MRRQNKCRSIDAIDIMQYENLINTLNRLIIKKSKKTADLKKRNGF